MIHVRASPHRTAKKTDPAIVASFLENYQANPRLLGDLFSWPSGIIVVGFETIVELWISQSSS
jgi:hypothetical protein